MFVQRKFVEPLLNWRLWVTPAVFGIFLTVVAQYSFLTFHILAELFAITISFILFAFAWSTRGLTSNKFLLYLACGYVWIGFLDLMHTLVYKGMNVFVEDSGNLAVQFWLSARYSEALLLLSAPFILMRKQNEHLLVISFGTIAGGLIFSILSGHFPTGFVEGKGLTDFKIYSEYLIIFIMTMAIIAVSNPDRDIPLEQRSLIVVSIVMTMCAELAFTFYVSVFGLSNLAGHIFKFFSFWFLFQAVVISNLKIPYEKLLKSEKRSSSLFENSEVSIWDEDMTGICEALDKLKLDGVSDLRKYMEDNEQTVIDIAGSIKVRHVNQATLRLFGAKNENDIVSRISRTFGPGSYGVFIDEMCAIWNKQRVFRSEASFLTLNGIEFRALISFEIPSTRDGFQSVPVSIVNITEHHQQQAALQESELRYRQMFNDNIAIFLIIDPNTGNIKNASIGACNYYGYSLTELVAMNIGDINILSKDEINTEMKRAKVEKRKNFNFRHQLASGEIRDVEVYSNPISFDTKTVLFSIVNDVNDRNLLESELSRRTHDLGKRVKEQVCLYSISQILNQVNIEIEDTLRAAVVALPAGWQYPEVTCARITLDEKSFSTDNFKETAWKQSSDIVSGDKKVGAIEIFYLKEKPEFDLGPFLLEEKQLITAIGSNIGSFLNRKKAEAESLQKTYALRDASLGAINAVAATIEKRDPYTSGHQKDVSDLAVKIAEDLGWSEFQIEGLRLGASIHDIGKIYIPAEILNRPGKLSNPEFEMIKSHPQVGYDILENTNFPWPIREMVLQHHERIDGTGYPNGLKGDQIVDEAKVIAVADVVEAISAHRPYRPALGIERGLEEIERGKGAAYDPEVVDSCIRIIRDQNFNWSH